MILTATLALVSLSSILKAHLVCVTGYNYEDLV